MRKIMKNVEWIILVILILMIGSFFIGFTLGEGNQKQIQHLQPKIEKIEIDRRELNQENVLYWLNYFEVQYPEIVLSQSIQECGWKYESYRAQEMNNIFGFETSAGALTFGHWIGSVVYYKKWQDTYYQEGNYFDFLQSYGYAADTLYVKKLKQIILILEKE